MAGLRNLTIHIGFKLDESQLQRAEQRIKKATISLAAAGAAMTAFVTIPILRLGKGFVGAASEIEKLDATLQAYTETAEEASQYRLYLIWLGTRTHCEYSTQT